MAGILLEQLSNKKIGAFALVASLSLLACFLLGGLIAPNPNFVQTLVAHICVKSKPEGQWYVPGDKECLATNIDEIEQQLAEKNLGEDDLVFAAYFPLARDNVDLEMSRWFQNIIGLLTPIVVQNKEFAMKPNPTLLLDVRLGYGEEMETPGTLAPPSSANRSSVYRPKHYKWTEIGRSNETRPLECTATTRGEGYNYDCEVLPLFELGSCHYAKYLINVQLPTWNPQYNRDVGKIVSMDMAIIAQTGGFTIVWFALKTFFFPLILCAMLWFWRLVSRSSRRPSLLENALFLLGAATTLMNLPIDWLTLFVNMPFMLVYSDLRQGIFYSALLVFWVIFAGEHMMDQNPGRKHVVFYWKQLAAVGLCCVCLFVFELCERGVQLANPFYSIWASESSKRMAYVFISLAGIAGCLYFVFLCYQLYQAWRNIGAKRSELPLMPEARRKFYAGLIYRFWFLLVVTLICAAMTVAYYVISQVLEGYGEWNYEEKPALEYTSAYLTGVYGTWNLYVFSLLILYAPSQKSRLQTEAVAFAAEADGDDEARAVLQDDVFAQSEADRINLDIPSEASVLVRMAKKGDKIG